MQCICMCIVTGLIQSSYGSGEEAISRSGGVGVDCLGGHRWKEVKQMMAWMGIVSVDAWQLS